ncbi:hypothetical protein HG537_0A02060 [Torulaspora globosa]|uniref:Amino acid permease/ SLC12A domain-containing protein n=1 Tax=Torulaspora globosa TaxID=48254 RepID=A0A7H9HKW3_9SACH|nr:hypothetical protein HG537_0A02060 [Torulaspora sp. CBS 2947]
MVHEYTLLPEGLRENITHLAPHEIFENLHTIIHDESNDVPEVYEHFEYEQQLDKSLLSGSSVVGLGFGLMSPVLGMCTSMGIGLMNGGPLTIMWGFPICGFFSFLCASSLGEVVSKYPMELHGASAMIAPESIKRICSWLTGWMSLLGNWFMSIGVTFAGGQLIISLIAMNDSHTISDSRLGVYTVLVYYAVVTVVGVVNLSYARYVELINKVCIYWIVYAVLFIDVLLLLFHRHRFRSLFYALFHFDNSLSGYKSAFLSFIIGFQQSNFTLQGFSMLPALADEVKKPEKDIPRGMSSAVLISTTLGIIFLFPIMLILPDLGNLFDNNKVLPIVNIFTESTDSTFVSVFLILLILGNLFFSGIGSITTSSRAVYSFGRDHAIPFHSIWTYVDPCSESKVPKYAVLLSMGVSYILGLLPLVSTAAFNAFIGCAVLCLCSATLIPLILVLLTGRRTLRNAPIKIKYKIGWVVNIGSVVWLLLSMLSVCLPPQIPVTAKTMNYALVVFVACFISIIILYFRWGNVNFQLPLVDKLNKDNTTMEAGETECEQKSHLSAGLEMFQQFEGQSSAKSISDSSQQSPSDESYDLGVSKLGTL